jgi:hypothetical protein
MAIAWTDNNIVNLEVREVTSLKKARMHSQMAPSACVMLLFSNV